MKQARSYRAYLKQSDEEFERSLFKDDDPKSSEWLPKEEWTDPRRGDLFALIDSLKSDQQQTEAL